MKKAYHLAQCSTCQRILEEINWQGDSQNIREEKITEHQIDEMANLSGSYESLFSRRAMKYKSMGLKEKFLSESDYKRLILEEDTFLKRPVFIVNDSIFIGNGKKTVEALKKSLDE
jgi:arsenate reductase